MKKKRPMSKDELLHLAFGSTEESEIIFQRLYSTSFSSEDERHTFCENASHSLNKKLSSSQITDLFNSFNPSNPSNPSRYDTFVKLANSANAFAVEKSADIVIDIDRKNQKARVNLFINTDLPEPLLVLEGGFLRSFEELCRDASTICIDPPPTKDDGFLVIFEFLFAET